MFETIGLSIESMAAVCTLIYIVKLVLDDERMYSLDTSSSKRSLLNQRVFPRHA